jgi:hypothetical protein
VFVHDLVLQFLKGLVLVAFVWLMKGGIVVEPLAVGDGIKLFQDASHPLAGFLVGVDLSKVPGLNHTTLLGRESEKEVVPANQILDKDSITNLGGQQQWGGFQVWVTESLQVLEDCHLEEWVGVFFSQISFKGGEVGLPWFISFFCSAHKHMLCCFRLVTAGATVVGLLFPELESGIHATVFRSVFGDSPAVTEFQRSHEVLHAFQSTLVMAVGGIQRGWL